MKKKLFVLALIAVALSGCATAGAGIRTSNAYSYNWFPTVDVMVANDCVASTIYVKPPRGVETPIKFGSVETISLTQYPGQYYLLLLMVRGVGDEGSFLGSDSRTFYTDRYGRREESWHVDYLRGGVRPCR